MGETTAGLPVVIGMGELLWDCFGDVRRVGGAPANVAFHANQLGTHGVVVSRVGDDMLGRDLLDRLRGSRLDTEFVQLDDRRPTGTVTVEMSAPDHPDYTIHDPAAWDHLQMTPELDRLVRRTSAICFGSLGQRHEPSRTTIQRAVAAARQALVVYDVNLRKNGWNRGIIERSLHAAAVVKLNDEEVPVVAGLFGFSDDHELFARQLRQEFGARLVCVTRGAHGCALFAEGDAATAPGIATNVVDTVGAGDAFAAALIAGLLRGWRLGTIARLANEVGALVASRSGATPDLRAEYAKLMSRAAQEGRS